MKFAKGDILVPKAKQYPDCAIVVDGYDSAGRLVMHPLGGGLQAHLPAVSSSVFRLVDEVERAGALFRHGRFTLADGDHPFTGWASGQKWNGWEMPRFELEVGKQILAWMGDEKALYDGVRDGFITVSQDGEEEVWPAESITESRADPQKMKSNHLVFPIGMEDKCAGTPALVWKNC